MMFSKISQISSSSYYIQIFCDENIPLFLKQFVPTNLHSENTVNVEQYLLNLPNSIKTICLYN